MKAIDADALPRVSILGYADTGTRLRYIDCVLLSDIRDAQPVGKEIRLYKNIMRYDDSCICEGCKGAVLPSDHFCRHCGAMLGEIIEM